MLAGGLGTRMKSDTPKHFHRILGRRMVDWVVEAARAVDADPLVVVTSPQGVSELDGIQTAVQREPRGTGDAWPRLGRRSTASRATSSSSAGMHP